MSSNTSRLDSSGRRPSNSPPIERYAGRHSLSTAWMDELRNERAPWASAPEARQDIEMTGTETTVVEARAQAEETDSEDADGDADEGLMDVDIGNIYLPRHLGVTMESWMMGDDHLRGMLSRLGPQAHSDMRELLNHVINLHARQAQGQEELLPSSRRQLPDCIVFPHLQEIEQLSLTRRRTIFSAAIDTTERYTARLLSDVLPGLQQALSVCLVPFAIGHPLNLYALDYIVATFGEGLENFSWEDTINAALSQFGLAVLSIMLFYDPLPDASSCESANRHLDWIFPGHGNHPMLEGRIQTLRALERIEADNVGRGLVNPDHVVFGGPFDMGRVPTAMELKLSLPGIDVAIRNVFGGGTTTRPIDLEYLDNLAESYLIRRRGGINIDGEAVDARTWTYTLNAAIENRDAEGVKDELFADWVDRLPEYWSPCEQQIYHLMESYGRDLSDSALALFKRRYAAYRENEGRREVRDASEQLRAIVRRQAQRSRAIPPPPICYPQTLQLHESAEGARREEHEARAAAETEQQLPRNDDGDEHSDAMAFSEGDRYESIYMEGVGSHPPILRFINTWFYYRREELAEDDTDEGQWCRWIEITERLRRLPREAVHRVAYLNVVEGTGVEVLLNREEFRQRCDLASQQRRVETNELPEEPTAQQDLRRRLEEMSTEERYLYIREEYSRILSNLRRDYQEARDDAPCEVRERVTRLEDSWRLLRAMAWSDGNGCTETPAADGVRAFYSVVNCEQAENDGNLLAHMEYELSLAHLFDEITHHEQHSAELERAISSNTGENASLVVRLPLGPGPED